MKRRNGERTWVGRYDDGRMAFDYRKRRVEEEWLRIEESGEL